MAMIKLGVVMLLFGLPLLGCPSGEKGSSIGAEGPEQTHLPQIRVNLPPPPSFQKEHAPERYTDSSYSVYGLKKNIATTLSKQVRVKGFLRELYECPVCPKGATCKACDKPHFWLADRASGPKQEALLVSDYPKLDPQTKKKISFEVGASYYVMGTFSKSSPTGFSNSEGLLVFSEAKRVTEE